MFGAVEYRSQLRPRRLEGQLAYPIHSGCRTFHQVGGLVKPVDAVEFGLCRGMDFSLSLTTCQRAARADLLERNRIKRVPIVANGKLVGIVSRANLVQALATLRDAIEPSTQSDTVIREEVMAQLNLKPWGQYAILNATVEDGVVKLWGFIASEAQKEAVQVTVEEVRGVRGVENNLVVPTSVDED